MKPGIGINSSEFFTYKGIEVHSFAIGYHFETNFNISKDNYFVVITVKGLETEEQLKIFSEVIKKATKIKIDGILKSLNKRK